MNRTPTGYGPSNQWQNLTFDGDERKFEIWEMKFLSYMKIKKLKNVLVGDDVPTDEQNEMAFAEMLQFLDDRSIALIIRDARDKGREAFHILKNHYAGSGKPRVLTLYKQLSCLKKSNTELITDYLLRAETTASSLKSAGQNIDDQLLIAMVLKGLPSEYSTLEAVITNSETIDTFTKFKQSLRNFEETETTR